MLRLSFALGACLGLAQELMVVEHGRKPRGGRSSAVTAVEDIQRRVVAAGGSVGGVLTVSLAWASADDLDLHLVIPGEGEINYHARARSGGELDVDMCVSGRSGSNCKERPVENIVFMHRAPAGKYRAYVQNFNYHADVKSRAVMARDVLDGNRKKPSEPGGKFDRNRVVNFEVLIKVEGSHHIFSGLCTPAGKTQRDSNIRVFEFEYLPGLSPSLVPLFEAPANPECGDPYALPGPDAKSGRLPGGAAGSVERGAGRQPRAGAGRQPAGARPSSGHKPRKGGRSSDAKVAALGAIRASGREGLSSKPAKALNGLLRDLSESCRGCIDKSEIVDKLLKVAGVKDEL